MISEEQSDRILNKLFDKNITKESEFDFGSDLIITSNSLVYQKTLLNLVVDPESFLNAQTHDIKSIKYASENIMILVCFYSEKPTITIAFSNLTKKERLNMLDNLIGLIIKKRDKLRLLKNKLIDVELKIIYSESDYLIDYNSHFSGMILRSDKITSVSRSHEVSVFLLEKEK